MKDFVEKIFITAPTSGTGSTAPASTVPDNEIVDVVSATVTYYGVATPGTHEDAAGWAIAKELTAGGITKLTWAGGGARAQRWVDRATLIYEDQVGDQPPINEDPPPPTPPPVADAPNTLQTLFDDMRLTYDSQVRSWSHASVVCASTAALQQATRPIDKNAGIYWGSKANNILSWSWVHCASDTTSVNTAVQVRRGEVYILRISTGQWQRLYKGRPSGVRWLTYPSGAFLYPGETGFTTNIDAEIVQCVPSLATSPNKYSFELWTPAGQIANFGHDVKAVFCTSQARLALINGGGTDDRALSRFYMQVGGDFWAYPNDGLGMKQTADGTTVQFNGYPRKQMDGGCGRVKRVTNDWQAFNFISLDPGFDGGWPPPWGNYSQNNPWQHAPYVLTDAELTANPPPLNNYTN